MFLRILILFIVCAFAINLFGQTENRKITVTTSSKKALELYKKGFDFENKLQIDKAEISYKQAINLDSKFALAYVRLAMLRDNFDVRRKFIAEAIKHIDSVSEGEKLWILGRNAFYGMGKDENEYKFFEQLVKLYPEDEQANYIYGYLNHHHGGNNLPKAILHLEKAIKLNPNYALPYNDLAYAYMKANDFKNSERIIQKYINLLPNAANPYDTYAEMLMRNGQYAKSIKMYDKVLSINPKYPWAIIGKAANLNFLDRHKEARRILPKLNDLKLSDYEYRHKWRARVVSYIDEGKLDQAIKVLEEQYQDSIKRENLTMQYLSLSRIVRLHFENKKPSEGLQAYRRFNDFSQSKITNEKTKKRIVILKNYYEAYANYLNGELVSAKNNLKKFEAENGSANNDSKLLKTFILLKDNKYDLALKTIKTSDLDNPYNIYWLGEIYKLKGDKKNADLWFGKVSTKLEMNNLDYALVRRKTEKRIWEELEK